MKRSSLLAAVAAFGLPDQPGTIRTEVLRDDEWTPFVNSVRRQRLAGHLHAAVAHEALPVSHQQAEEVAELHLRACTAALQLERRLVEIAEILDNADIEFVVLKGTAVAHLAYADPALRSFGDNDLLLRSDQFDHGVRVLTEYGYVRQSAEARPGFDRRFAKGVTLDGPQQDELDLHRNLVFGTFGFKIDLDELFRSAEPFTLAGRTFQGLGPETRLLHACYHASLGDPVPRFSSVRDIAQMLATGTHRPARVLALATRWQAHAVLARGVGLCRDLLEVSPDGEVARATDGYVPTRREQRAIDSYVGDNRRFAAKAVASLPYIDGVGEKLAFLRAITAPQDGFAESFGGRSGLAWLRRGARSLVSGRRR